MGSLTTASSGPRVWNRRWIFRTPDCNCCVHLSGRASGRWPHLRARLSRKVPSDVLARRSPGGVDVDPTPSVEAARNRHRATPQRAAAERSQPSLFDNSHLYLPYVTSVRARPAHPHQRRPLARTSVRPIRPSRSTGADRIRLLAQRHPGCSVCCRIASSRSGLVTGTGSNLDP